MFVVEKVLDFYISKVCVCKLLGLDRVLVSANLVSDCACSVCNEQGRKLYREAPRCDEQRATKCQKR